MKRDIEYTRSVIDRLEKVNESIDSAVSSGDTKHLEVYNLSLWEGEETKEFFIEWDRIQDTGLPTHLKYLSGLNLQRRTRGLGRTYFV
jgi:hypothetical protein